MPDLRRDVRPVTYLKNHAAEAIRSVSEDGRALLITQHGESKAILLAVEEYERLRRQVALLTLGNQSIRSLETRGGRTHEQVIARVRKAIRSADGEN